MQDPNAVSPDRSAGVVYDYVKRIDLKSWKSYRPLGQIALDMEGVRMHEAYELVRAVTLPKQICYFNVDCVAATIAKAHRPALQRAVEACRYPDGTPMFKLKGRGTKVEYTDEGSAGSRNLPITNHTLEYSVPPWQDTLESETGTDAFAAELLRTADAGQSLLLIGVGGTGKTYLPNSVTRRRPAAPQYFDVRSLTPLPSPNLFVISPTPLLHPRPP